MQSTCSGVPPLLTSPDDNSAVGAAPAVHPGDDNSPCPQHSSLANGYGEQSLRSPTVDAELRPANGFADGAWQSKHADVLRNGYLSGHGTPLDGRPAVAPGTLTATTSAETAQPSGRLPTGENLCASFTSNRHHPHRLWAVCLDLRHTKVFYVLPRTGGRLADRSNGGIRTLSCEECLI